VISKYQERLCGIELLSQSPERNLEFTARKLYKLARAALSLVNQVIDAVNLSSTF